MQVTVGVHLAGLLLVFLANIQRTAALVCRDLDANHIFLVTLKDDALLGVAQSKVPCLSCPVGSTGTGGNPPGGDHVGKLLAEGVSHQRAIARLQVGGIHVLGRLVKSLDRPRKVDGTALPTRDRQELAVTAPDADLPEPDGLVPSAGVRAGVFLARKIPQSDTAGAIGGRIAAWGPRASLVTRAGHGHARRRGRDRQRRRRVCRPTTHAPL